MLISFASQNHHPLANHILRSDFPFSLEISSFFFKSNYKFKFNKLLNFQFYHFYGLLDIKLKIKESIWHEIVNSKDLFRYFLISTIYKIEGGEKLVIYYFSFSVEFIVQIMQAAAT